MPCPPLYTNNKLIPVDGFNPSAADKARFDILDRRVGTDPRYALQTRKGTGYYKVPSLKGRLVSRAVRAQRLRSRRWRTGSTRLACTMITCLLDMPVLPAITDPSKATSSD